jgi:hypothetical protein
MGIDSGIQEGMDVGEYLLPMLPPQINISHMFMRYSGFLESSVWLPPN